MVGGTEGIHSRLDNDLPYYCRKVLKIETKQGGLQSFIFNKPQRLLHAAVEEQRRKTGKVRVIIVKARQQGFSTYVSGRGYHKATRKHHKKIFILSHQALTTDFLFQMVQRYQENSPKPLKPKLDIANRREYQFANIGSQYVVGTAGSSDVGRGGTIQFFHGSEVAYWENTDSILTGALQAVADLDDTEIFLESTGNGMGNMFYQKAMDALKGRGDYILFFSPWFWSDEYTRSKPPDGRVALDDEEKEYQTVYTLTLEQMYWRRAKIIELGESKFRREYPANVMEAFQTSGDSLIAPESIMKARKSTVSDENAPLIIGVDPGRKKDRTVFAYRRGREFLQPEIFTFDADDEEVQMRIAGMLAQRINRLDPVKVFIDVGEGNGIADRLKELGYGQIIHRIPFGMKALEEDVYLNKRVEMWCLMKKWFEGEEGEVSMPDDNKIQQDLAMMPEERTTSNSKTKLVDKETIKSANRGLSPDIGDAMALTFAYPVRHPDAKGGPKKIKRKGSQKGPLSTLNRYRRYNNRSRS